jgi:hypothetical protein
MTSLCRLFRQVGALQVAGNAYRNIPDINCAV